MDIITLLPEKTAFAMKQCQKLAQEMNIPVGVAILLFQRGITDTKQAASFLYPKLTGLPSPFLMHGMDKSVELVMQAYKQQGDIFVHGDYDVDGISGTALLAQFFASLGITATCYQPNRLTEGYGLQKKIIDQHKPGLKGKSLLITVDCGISSHAEIQFARENGYKVIVTDHHLLPDILPEADAILNPKQPDCNFPYEDLAGVGVAFFLAMGVRSRMVEQGLITRDNAPGLKDLLSLVALGTIADVMPLTGVNRILVRAGLEVISKRSVPWTWALCDRAGLKEGAVTAGDISFRLAPRINAPGRLGKPESAFQLLTSTETVAALELADTLEEINRQRRLLESETIDLILQECAQQDSKGYDGLVVHGDYHPGIIGIIASRITDEFGKPVFILTDDPAGQHILKGSGRSVEHIHLYEILKECSDTLIQYGGHAMAAGLTVKKDMLPQFKEKFNISVSKAKAGLKIQKEEKIAVDYVVGEAEVFDTKFMQYYQLLEPFGSGNPEPVFLVKGQQMNGLKIIYNHLKYSVNVNGVRYKGIGFGMADKFDLAQNNPVDILFKLKKNVFRGEESIEFHAINIT